ncbi:MAG TPA: twin-arginine translocation signal domain-containing protein, partial [Bacillota bacterium]|nr:twin-arginine translocation signal domain-containing protein [Bacillota bacterium]
MNKHRIGISRRDFITAAASAGLAAYLQRGIDAAEPETPDKAALQGTVNRPRLEWFQNQRYGMF